MMQEQGLRTRQRNLLAAVRKVGRRILPTDCKSLQSAKGLERRGLVKLQQLELPDLVGRPVYVIEATAPPQGG